MNHRQDVSSHSSDASIMHADVPRVRSVVGKHSNDENGQMLCVSEVKLWVKRWLHVTRRQLQYRERNMYVAVKQDYDCPQRCMCFMGS